MSNPFEVFKDSLLFAQIEDFHDGIISAYEEGGIEHGALNAKKAFMSAMYVSINSRSLLEQETAQDIHILWMHNMLTEITVLLRRALFFDENKIGEVLIQFRTSKIYDVSYNTGVEVGNGIVGAYKFVKDGIGKEILESIIIFLLKRKNKQDKIVIQIFKFDTALVESYSIQGDIEFQRVYLEIDSANDVDYNYITFNGNIEKKIQLSPKLLRDMREGRVW